MTTKTVFDVHKQRVLDSLQWLDSPEARIASEDDHAEVEHLLRYVLGRLTRKRDGVIAVARCLYGKLDVVCEGGVVQDVEGLPESWSYEVDDQDSMEEDEDEDDEADRYRNFYHCDACDNEWADGDCDSMHDDRCAYCNVAYTPYKSEKLDHNGEVIEEIDHTKMTPDEEGG